MKGSLAALLVLAISIMGSGCSSSQAGETPVKVEAKEMSKDMKNIPDEEWRKRLTPEQYHVTRQKGTERAFTGEYWDNHRAGTYKCVACGETLFLSKNKYDSGTGWPSFDRPESKDKVAVEKDRSYGMVRDEVVCSNCGAHLGHVFDDGPATTGKRYCINSASLAFEAEGAKSAQKEEPVVKEPEKAKYTAADDEALRRDGKDVAYFAGGCFWGVEDSLKGVNGVLDTTVGYTGGHTPDPTYKDVCSHGTGHAETVRVVFDPKVVDYSTLVTDFLKIHDPTTLNRQGPDVGDQYRSEIFYSDDKQAELARKAIEARQTSLGSKKIVTQINKLQTFYSAEDYHQDYFAKHGGASCHVRL